MEPKLANDYQMVRTGRSGFFEQRRGFIAVWGKEAIQFLDGLITNDMKTLADGGQMLAAFPNAQGRLMAVVRVLRHGDRFLVETEEATRETLYTNLFRFTFAGDFFVEDLSEQYLYFEIFGPKKDLYHSNVVERIEGAYAFELPYGAGYFVPNEDASGFRQFLTDENSCIPVSPELRETLRIENGVPRYGVDMDDTTIVPELGLSGLISYNKGCYIGQEIIARIHFRGHVAKRLAGLVLSESEEYSKDLVPGVELSTIDGKNAGRVTSVASSVLLKKMIALAFVRYDHLEPGTEVLAGEHRVVVTHLPFTA